MAEDPPPPDEPRRPWEKQPRDRTNRRDDRDSEEEEEWEPDERPRRRRRPRPEEEEYDPALKMLVPLNTSALAIVAGYLGLISVLCLPAPFALLVGILALQHLKRNPKLDGKGRAIFAIVMGTIFSMALCVVGFLMLVG